MPSAKYSCSTSPLMFSKRQHRDGRLIRERERWAGSSHPGCADYSGLPTSRTRHARIGSAMFFRICVPMSSKATSTLPRICRWASSDMQMPPGSEIPSRRAAMLTPSPKISLSSMMMSPTWMPMRNSIRGSVARPRSGPPCCAGFPAHHRINGAGKLDQHPVTGRLYDPASISAYCGVDEGLSEAFSRPACLLRPPPSGGCNQHIRRQNRRQSPFHAVGSQEIPLELQFQP